MCAWPQSFADIALSYVLLLVFSFYSTKIYHDLGKTTFHENFTFFLHLDYSSHKQCLNSSAFGEQKMNIWWSQQQLCIWIVTNPTFDHYTDIWHLKTITNIDIWTAINGNGGNRNHWFLTLLVEANFPASVFTENSHNLRELQMVMFFYTIW